MSNFIFSLIFQLYFAEDCQKKHKFLFITCPSLLPISVFLKFS